MEEDQFHELEEEQKLALLEQRLEFLKQQQIREQNRKNEAFFKLYEDSLNRIIDTHYKRKALQEFFIKFAFAKDPFLEQPGTLIMLSGLEVYFDSKDRDDDASEEEEEDDNVDNTDSSSNSDRGSPISYEEYPQGVEFNEYECESYDEDEGPRSD